MTRIFVKLWETEVTKLSQTTSLFYGDRCTYIIINNYAILPMAEWLTICDERRELYYTQVRHSV